MRQKALQSASDEIRKEAHRFGQDESGNLLRIAKNLREHRYKFSPAVGHPATRKGKKPRPIVVATIEDRVVQRSLLTVIQEQDAVQRLLNHPGSFGGLKGKKVKDAIQRICVLINAESGFYIRSDISGFYTKIRRMEALDTLFSALPDDSLEQIMIDATEVDLVNKVELRKDIELFPGEEIGVAQGSALSALLGNVLLNDFDNALNTGNIHSIRWIDDFMILAPNQSQAWGAFRKAKEILGALGLSPYSPSTDTEKAAQGSTRTSIEFLGCQISKDFVSPSRKVRSRIIKKIEEDLKESLLLIRSGYFSNSGSYNKAFVTTLQNNSNRIRAWASAFSFCNERASFGWLDMKINDLVSEYERSYFAARRKMKPPAQRRALGVWLVADGKEEPIYPLNKG